MLEDLCIHKSVIDRVRTLFTVPIGGFEIYTIYGESQLRLIQAAKLDVNDLKYPRVFLLEAYMRPTQPVLPMVIVETAVADKQPFELGNSNGRVTECMVHVIGRMVGERKDIASYLADNMGVAIPIYDYYNGSKVFTEPGIVEDGHYKIEEYSLKRDDLRQESSLDLWSVVSFTILTTK